MFLVVPLVEFWRLLGVDINVHHENPATFLCHMSVSSVAHSINWGAILGGIPDSRAVERDLPSHRGIPQ
jgi:hypothetical protein